MEKQNNGLLDRAHRQLQIEVMYDLVGGDAQRRIGTTAAGRMRNAYEPRNKIQYDLQPRNKI